MHPIIHTTCGNTAFYSLKTDEGTSGVLKSADMLLLDKVTHPTPGSLILCGSCGLRVESGAHLKLEE